jgi:probable rRNA maturation factor
MAAAPRRTTGKGRDVASRAPAIVVEIANLPAALPPAEDRLREVVLAALEEMGIKKGRVSVAVVDDTLMGRLNQQFLNHEGPTDVLSFPLEQSEGWLEGEIVVSADTARRVAPKMGWTAAEELLLYVVHGVLHLAGHDDATEKQRTQMRQCEQKVLGRFGIIARYEEGRPNDK